MKRVILTIMFGISAIAVNAQAVFNVKSPSNIAGNYDFSWGEPSGGWGCPDFNVAGTFIEDTVMIVEDGTPGMNAQGNPISQEGCNTLTNDLTGKIALVYRNTCEFGLKALNAQNAGAIGVIIVNREPGVIAIGPGVDGVNVTIPVTFVDNSTGAQIVNAMAGGSVVVFIGNKIGFFDNDLGMNEADIFIPTPNTQNSMIAQNAAEHSFRVGAFVNNFGINNQTNITLNANITFNGNELYDESQTFDLLSLANVGIELPVFSQPTYPIGKYTITYTLSSDSTDEYDSDNSYTTDFFVSQNVFSYVKLNTEGTPEATSGLRPSGTAGTDFTSCIHFRNDNASRTIAQGLYFSGSVTAENFDGRLVEVYAYQWNNQFTDIDDSVNAVFTQYDQVGFANYNYVEDSMSLKTVYAPFDVPVTLIDDQRYLFCIKTYEADMYLGYGSLDYSLVYANDLQPLFPIDWDQFYLSGFGADAPPSIGVRLVDVNSASLEETEVEDLNIYPNPAKEKITISGNDLADFETIELRDQLGRSIATWKVNAATMSFDVSKFATGNYHLVLNGAKGLTTKQVQINH